MRTVLFPLNDADLAVALATLNERAQHEGRGTGFYGFHSQPIIRFISENRPTDASGTSLRLER
jgi:hypothetical protein